jgi:RNA-directed DNA polymerase
MVRVHYGEGVAIHTGPESCSRDRKATGEALTGDRAGQVLSGESKVFHLMSGRA